MTRERRPRRWWWLVVAAALLALTAWLVQDRGGPAPRPRPEVELPRRLRPSEQQRAQARLTLPADAGADRAPPRVRDPLLGALSAGNARSTLVLEANALRYSPLGELLLQCLTTQGGSAPLDALRKAGIDPLRDLDRAGVTANGFTVSGDFRRADWSALLGDAPQDRYGQATVTRVGGEGSGRGTLYVTRWGDSLVHLGTSEEDAHGVVDVLEGRVPAPKPILTPDQTYGEMYGVLSGEDLGRTLGGGATGDGDAMAKALVQAARQVELHLDARKDVGLVANVVGEDERKLDDLGRTLGGALALARAQAKASGDAETAELLEYAQVLPSSGDRLGVELALPLDFVARKLAFCQSPRDAGP